MRNIYRGVGNRIAINILDLGNNVSIEKAFSILKENGINEIEICMLSIAKELVTKAQWKLRSGQWEAPLFFDCSSLTKWLYGQKGIWIPRRPIQQFEHCKKSGESISLEHAKQGDLMFTTSQFKNGVRIGDNDGWHVFFVSDNKKAICATNSEFGIGVVEVPFTEIFKTRKLRKIYSVTERRIPLTTFLIPPNREIETSDDIKHIILQSL